MRKLLNTLYIQQDKAYLGLEGQTVAIRLGSEVVARVPLHALDGIVVYGCVGCSPSLMHACAEKGVTISFMSITGQFLARVQGPTSGNVLLRRDQYRRADDLSACASIATSIVGAKIANSRTVLLRSIRDHPDKRGQTALRIAVERLAGYLKRLVQFNLPLDVVRGLEGEAAAEYFRVFDHLIVAQKDYFTFHERSRRPPLDAVNALLSFLYSLLTHDAVSAAEANGLDPAVGFLHRDRPGRPGLALDLVEELRPVLADRVALSLINRRQVNPRGFQVAETGGVIMDETTRKEVLAAYQARKRDELVHPFLKERIPLGLVFHIQARLLARHLRGELDGYPAFFWK
ncbi:MAG: type I-C CRISPR-associated endonuclease Cas1c [Thermoleophilia bacterium]|nr:type I-C CRISPR-associated endonuclease Cas1c [Thermoleophilia bacterium]